MSGSDRGHDATRTLVRSARPGKGVEDKNEEIHFINNANDHNNITNDSYGANHHDNANGCNDSRDDNNHFFNDGRNNCADDINDTHHNNDTNNDDHHNVINGIDIRRADIHFPERIGNRLRGKLFECKVCCMVEQRCQLGRWIGQGQCR